MSAHTSLRRLEPSLPQAAYIDRAYYAREQTAIFWDQWFCAGRSERLAKRGSYCVLDVAGESIIAVRGDDDRIYAHVNLCRHRGSRLLCGEGVVRGAIRCPYHGWAYGLDGTLVASPFIPMDAIPDSSRQLHHVAVEEWGGFFFVHLSPERAAQDGSTLLAQLSTIPERLARYPLAGLRTAHTIRYDVAANWKVLLENYNECYHCAGVHPELCRVVPAFKQHGGASLDWDRGIPHREGAFTFSFSGTTPRRPFAGLNDDERTRHKGELVYPNFLLSLSADHIAAFTVWPDGPEKSVVICDFLFDPEEMAKPEFDPYDAIEFWNVVNKQDWAICEGVQSGMKSRFFKYGYYAPMEDASLDIRRYIASRLGMDAVAISNDDDA